MQHVPKEQHTVGVYTEPCHVGHFGAFSRAAHINGLRNARYRLCAGGGGGDCVQTEGLYSGTYALQIEIAAGYGLASVPVAAFSHNKTRSLRRPKPPMDERTAERRGRGSKAARWIHVILLLPETEHTAGEHHSPCVHATKLRKKLRKGNEQNSTVSYCGSPCAPIRFRSRARVWHGSSAEPHKLSAITSVKPCLRVTNVLCFLPARLSRSSVGSPKCDVHHR